jgi:dTDP-4-dehydrorhamnose reductase
MSEQPILIVGKNGQLARCLDDQAIVRNLPIVAVGRPDLDIESEASIDRVIDEVAPSAIINAAAYTAVDRAETESARVFSINCTGAGLLAAQAGRRGIPFVHFSTDYVFDGTKTSPYVEADATGPINVYGSSKLASETKVIEACPCAVVLRTSWVYSPYGTNFVRTMQRLARSQCLTRVVDDQFGTPTSASDLASAALTIVDNLHSARGCEAAGIYHLAGQGEISWHGFAAAIFSNLARRGQSVSELEAIATEDYPTPARRPRNSRLDSSKAAQAFGVRLPQWQVSLETCLDRLAAEEVGIC